MKTIYTRALREKMSINGYPKKLVKRNWYVRANLYRWGKMDCLLELKVTKKMLEFHSEWFMEVVFKWDITFPRLTICCWDRINDATLLIYNCPSVCLNVSQRPVFSFWNIGGMCIPSGTTPWTVTNNNSSW